MSGKIDIQATLAALDPAQLNYAEWLAVGMALHAEGLPVETWRDWSRSDAARFHEHDFEAKWRGFSVDGGVTPGTLAKIARDHGVTPPSADRGQAFDWGMTEAVIPPEQARVVEPGYVEHCELPRNDEPGWMQLDRYLAALFDDGDVVGYCTAADKGRPASAGVYTRTAGELRRALASYHDIGKALSTGLDGFAGAWIRFNPLDGRGVRNANVAAFRYALAESDVLGLGEQLGLIRALRLPCAAIVYSGGKSVHAVVRVDADGYDQYQERVRYLYAVLRENGFCCDEGNKNPSRLSRMPGVLRNGTEQTLIAVGEGCGSWGEWVHHIEDVTDRLPDIETWGNVRENLPELAPEVVAGVLRRGHKMLLAGPSKAGKSWALLELARAIACGGEWMGHRCICGNVLYVNLEIDRASFLHRIAAHDEALGALTPEHAANLHVLNLRGYADSIDRLGPRICSKAEKLGVELCCIVIDPLYKVMAGDENSAGDMAAFFREFDRMSERTGASMVYCHHHAKGSLGDRRSIDRASGSGVFGRDPDAVIDLQPADEPSRADGASAWVVEYTLREFAEPKPLGLRFSWPVHVIDPGISVGKKQQAKAAETRAEGMHAKVNELLDEAACLCGEQGMPVTRQNVFTALASRRVGGRPVTRERVKSWTNPARSPWCTWRYDEDSGLLVAAPDDDELLDGF